MITAVPIVGPPCTALDCGKVTAITPKRMYRFDMLPAPGAEYSDPIYCY